VPAAVPTLSRRQLLLAALDRQLLLARSPRLSIPKVLERMGALQAQYAPSMYIGLWSRMHGFERTDLDRALGARTVAQGTLMRSTIHLASAGDYWRFAAGIRPSRQAWFLQAFKVTDARKMDEAVVALREFLRAADGPQKPKAIEDAIGVPVLHLNQWTELVRVPPSGTWDRRRADLYALAEDWLGARPEPASASVDPDEALEHLVRRYLGAFGPAPVADIASWSGVPVREMGPVIERMRPKLRPFRSEAGDDLVDVPRARIPDVDTPVPVRFIPVWDALTLVNMRRTGVLPEEYRKVLFNTKNPHSFHTFLVDGVIAGTWKHNSNGIELTPFENLSKATRTALEEEAEDLDLLHR
jgi:hypothetical protein